MSDYDRNPASDYGHRIGGRAAADAIDQGLRSYMLSVYNYMAMALVVTAVAALGVAALAFTDDPAQAVGQLANGKYVTSLGATIYTSPLKWVVMFAPLVMVFVLAARVHSMSLSGAQMMFWVYSVLVGVSLGWIFAIYAPGSIVQILLVTAATFGALSLYGYTTRKDISGWGSFLFMGLIGIIIAAIVNIFIGSPAIHFAINVIGVLVFAGLTAYDTQQIKEMYNVSDDGTVQGRKAIMGALRLYLDFLNMFLMLLQLFGNRE